VDTRVSPHAAQAVTALYQAHVLGLVKLGFVMLGDPAAAEDVVHDAFLGLYRHWDRLADTASAHAYVRSSVLNGCRTVLRHQARHGGTTADGAVADTPLESAEALVLLGEEHRAVLAAIRRLPD
jgi:DNA-directed RNA polymerase specialized sigma24 family protein